MLNKLKRLVTQHKALLNLLDKELADKLTGVYLYGSAVHGGLKTESDIDYLVITNQILTNDNKQRLIQAIMTWSRKIGEESELRYIDITIVVVDQLTPWTYPPKQDFVYGEWLREHFEEGWIPENEANPDLTLILYQAQAASRKLYGQYNLTTLIPEIPFEDVKLAMQDSMSRLIEDLPGDEGNTLLTMCRMIMTKYDENIYTKDQAGQRLLQYLPTAHQQIVELAIQEYRDGMDVNWSAFGVQTTAHYLSEVFKQV